METIIYLIRHSEQLKNKEINTSEDSQIVNEKIILTVNGEQRAKILSESQELLNIDMLWSSHYTRAILTAKYIAESNGIAINIDSNFGERKLGDLNSLNEMAKTKQFTYTTEQLLDHELKNNGGENLLEVRARAMKSFNEILQNNKGKRIVIVSHGAAIKYMLLEWCQFNRDTHNIEYKGTVMAGEKLNSPEVFKLIFNDNKLIDLKKLELK